MMLSCMWAEIRKIKLKFSVRDELLSYPDLSHPPCSNPIVIAMDPAFYLFYPLKFQSGVRQ